MPDSTLLVRRALRGDAHVIHNAGGRASDDAIRSLVISYKLLGTKEWFVIHHSNCGMEFFTDETIRGLLANSLETAALGTRRFHRRRQRTRFRRGPVHRLADHCGQRGERGGGRHPQWNHPLVPASIPIYGYIYDVTTGRLVEVTKPRVRRCQLNRRRLPARQDVESVADSRHRDQVPGP